MEGDVLGHHEGGGLLRTELVTESVNVDSRIARMGVAGRMADLQEAVYSTVFVGEGEEGYVAPPSSVVDFCQVDGVPGVRAIYPSGRTGEPCYVDFRTGGEDWHLEMRDLVPAEEGVFPFEEGGGGVASPELFIARLPTGHLDVGRMVAHSANLTPQLARFPERAGTMGGIAEEGLSFKLMFDLSVGSKNRRMTSFESYNHLDALAGSGMQALIVAADMFSTCNHVVGGEYCSACLTQHCYRVSPSVPRLSEVEDKIVQACQALHFALKLLSTPPASVYHYLQCDERNALDLGLRHLGLIQAPLRWRMREMGLSRNAQFMACLPLALQAALEAVDHYAFRSMTQMGVIRVEGTDGIVGLKYLDLFSRLKFRDWLLPPETMAEAVGLLVHLREYHWLDVCGVIFRPLPRDHYWSPEEEPNRQGRRWMDEELEEFLREVRERPEGKHAHC